LAVTAAAVAVKVAVVAPEGTSTEAGTVKAEVRLLERATREPPVGAALERLTVQEVEVEAARLVLTHSSDESVTGMTGAVMDKDRGLVELPRDAVTVAL
jgi:hypothetical protein